MRFNNEFSYFMPGSNGMGVLLVHGLTGAPAEMKLVAKHLNRLGYTIYAPLLAGHGSDPQTLTKSCWQDWLDSVNAAATRLRAEVDSVFAAGICVGGSLAVISAHRNPGVIKAVGYYSPTFNYDGWSIPLYQRLLARNIWWAQKIKSFEFLHKLQFPETETIGVKSERMRRMMKTFSAEGGLDFFPAKALIEMYQVGIAVKRILPEITVPAIILHASEDDLSHSHNAEYINRHYNGPHELHWIPNSYHMVHIDQSKYVVDLCSRYFERYQTLDQAAA